MIYHAVSFASAITPRHTVKPNQPLIRNRNWILPIFYQSAPHEESCILYYSRDVLFATRHSDNYRNMWFYKISHTCYQQTAWFVLLSSSSHRRKHTCVLIIRFRRTQFEFLRWKVSFFYIFFLITRTAAGSNWTRYERESWYEKQVTDSGPDAPVPCIVRFFVFSFVLSSHVLRLWTWTYIKDMNEQLNNSFCFKY